MTFKSLFQMIPLCCVTPIFREKKFKEVVEKYRQERPKIQQQFSDLKVIRYAFFYSNNILFQPVI